MQELITRRFIKMRGEYPIEYPFTTFADVLKKEGEVFDFFKKLFLEGIPEFEGKQSVSTLPQLTIPQFAHLPVHDLIELALAADYRGKSNKQHECVQFHLLRNDPKTLAVEIPVWNDVDGGHIDLLRFDGMRFEIWDFKPDAHKEKKADSQVWRYRDLFCARTGIKHDLVDIGYFDDTNAYFLNSKT